MLLYNVINCLIIFQSISLDICYKNNEYYLEIIKKKILSRRISKLLYSQIFAKNKNSKQIVKKVIYFLKNIIISILIY